MEGKGSPSDVETLRGLNQNMSGTSICALCEGASMALGSFLEKFGDEFDYYAKYGRSYVEDARKGAVAV